MQTNSIGGQSCSLQFPLRRCWGCRGNELSSTIELHVKKRVTYARLKLRDIHYLLRSREDQYACLLKGFQGLAHHQPIAV